MAFIVNNAQAYSDQKNWSDTYLTEPTLIKALGPFDIDVACPPVMPWRTARTMYHHGKVDGLTKTWPSGKRAWMNPPYRGVDPWAKKFVDHGCGICLLNGRSISTRATTHVMEHASGIFIPKGRFCWYDADGNMIMSKGAPGRWFPSIIIGMDNEDALRLRALPLNGFPGVFLVGPKGRT